MQVLILAGGFAKRLWPLTLDKAKALLPVGGKPVISHIVEKIPVGVPIIVSTNTVFADDFSAWRQTHPDRDITIFVEPTQSEQTKKGALGAVGLAVKELAINDDLLIIGSDNFFTFSVEDFLNSTQNQPTMAVFDIKDREAAKRFGVVVCDGRRITHFQEKPENPASTLVVGACFWIPSRYLPDVREAAELMPDKLGGLFEHFLNKKIEAHVYSFTGYWNDIGSFDAYLDAHVQSGANLDIPAHLLDPKHNNTFEGVNHIDKNAIIENSQIRNSIILFGVTIKNSSVDTCIVDSNCALTDQKISNQIIRPD